MRPDELITTARTASLALAIAAAVATSGCGGGYGSNSTSYGNPNPAPSPTIAPGAQIIGLNLSGELPENAPNYGSVLGYFNSTGSIEMTSQVVHITAALPTIFRNFDGALPHTASFLGNATVNGAMFPAHFNGSETSSAANSVISTANFSSGDLNPGSTSAVYNSGPPGFYMFGCAFHYDNHGMRTVVIVQ